MDNDDRGGYRAEIPDEALAEALESVDKYDRRSAKEGQPSQAPNPSDEETVVEVEVDPQTPDQAPGAADQDLVSRLETDLEKARQEAREFHERMLRVAADADNIRKRALKERQDAIKFGQEGLLRDLLPVIDNLERTLAHVPAESQDPGFDALRQGVEMILRQFLTTLEKHDVKPFDSLGQPFDPNRHEALSRQETAEAEEGTVLSEMHRGYLLHDRLLRPALVSVACRPAAEPGAEKPGCPEEPASEASTDEQTAGPAGAEEAVEPRAETEQGKEEEPAGSEPREGGGDGDTGPESRSSGEDL